MFVDGPRTLSFNQYSRDTFAGQVRAPCECKCGWGQGPSVAAYLAAVTLHPLTLWDVMGSLLVRGSTRSNGLLSTFLALIGRGV